MRPEQKKEKRHDVLTIIALMAGMVFVLRMWPILLLMLIGVFGYALWLLFHLEKTPAATEMPPLLALPEPASEESMLTTAFALIQRRITEQVAARYPNAKWVWDVADARSRFAQGEPLSIMLGHAGGYQRAVVQVSNLQFAALSYISADRTDRTSTEEEEETTETQEPASEQESVDYGLLAFEWVEANLQELNIRCNEVIAQGQDGFRILAAQLPHGDSWQSICQELLRNGFVSAEPLADGIQVQIKMN